LQDILDLAVIVAFVASFAAIYAWHDNTVRPRGLLGEVADVRRKGNWDLSRGRIFVISRKEHRSDGVRLKYRSPGERATIRVTPGEARRIAAALREAASGAAPGRPSAGAP
jgi:hypothetical protein